MDAPLSRFFRRRSQDHARRQRSFARTWRRDATSAVFAAVLLPLGGAAHVRAAGPASTGWQNGSGHWSDAAHWSQGVPSSGTDTSNLGNSNITHDSTDGDSVYGTFQSNGAGNFYLSGGSLTGGAFYVNPSALFQLSGGATLRGATVSGANVTVSGSGTLDGVSILSGLDMSGGAASVVNGLTLNATATISNSQSMYLVGTQTVGSTSAGVINLGAVGGSAGYIQLQGVNGAKTMTIGPGVAVQGLNGVIQNYDYQSTLDNKGTLAADGAGHALSIGVTLINEGTIRASGNGAGGGTITLGGAVNNATGTLSAGTNSTVNLNGKTITGGTLTGGGTFAGGGTLVGVAFLGNSLLDLTNASASLIGGITLNGTANVANSQSLYLQNAQTVATTAAGAINLGAVGGSAGYLQLQGVDGAKTMTVGAGVTIQGLNGIIQNYDYQSTLDNKGTLAADGAGHSLSVSSAITNEGTLRASAGGAVALTGGGSNSGNTVTADGAGSKVTLGGTFANTNGTFLATNGGTFVLNAATVNGGTLSNNGGGGSPIAVVGASALNGVGGSLSFTAASAALSISGGSSLTGTSGVTNSQSLYLVGNNALSTANAAVLNLGAVGGSAGYLQLQGVDGAKTDSIGAGITVQGLNGVVQNYDYQSTLDNKGTLAADGTGHSLSVTTSVSNGGTLRASGGGGVTIGNGVDNTEGGTRTTRATQGVLSVDAGSAFNLAGQTIVGGTLAGGGTFTGGGTLNGLLVNANLDLSNASATIQNGITLNGTATVRNSQSIYLNNAQTVGSTSAGVINLGAAGGSAGYLQLQGVDGAKTITIGPGVTVQGLNGVVQNYDYQSTLDNKGTLAADGAGRTLSVSSTLVNEGNTCATGGGVVTVSAAASGPGTLSTGAGSTIAFTTTNTMTQAAGTSQIDGVVNLGSGNTFTVGGGTLQGTGTVTGNVANTGGNVSPGDSPGTLTVSGNYSQGANGVLSIEYTAAPVGATAHDLLAVGGTATLGGTLAVSYLGPRLASGGFLATTGEPGTSFDFLSFGTLANTNLGTLFANEYTSSAFGVANGFYVNGIASNATASGPAVYQLTQNGNVLHLNLQTAAAPEPSQWAGFGVGALGLGALALRARRRRAI